MPGKGQGPCYPSEGVVVSGATALLDGDFRVEGAAVQCAGGGEARLTLRRFRLRLGLWLVRDRADRSANGASQRLNEERRVDALPLGFPTGALSRLLAVAVVAQVSSPVVLVARILRVASSPRRRHSAGQASLAGSGGRALPALRWHLAGAGSTFENPRAAGRYAGTRSPR
jgi:hypothetical protein